MSDWTESLFVPVLLASRDAAILALAIGGILLLLGRKIPPAWRHLIWLLVAVRLLLPVLPPSPVSWQVLFPDTTASSLPVVKADARPSVLPTVSPPPPAGTALRPPTALVAESELQPLPPTIQSDPAPIPWRLFDGLACLWATGTIAMVLASTLLVLRFHRRLRRLTLPTHPREANARRLLESLARENGFPKVPRLLVTAAVTAPALTGLWKPIILLPPRSLEKLDDEALRFVLLHELAHLRRRDLWTNWILAVLRSLHWFNPFVWWAFHRLRVEAERATDVWVLERSGAGAATRYGEALLGLLEMDCSRPARLPGVVGVLESSRDLRSRIVAIARFTGRRSRLAVTGAALLLSGIAVVGLTQAPEQQIPDGGNPVTPKAVYVPASNNPASPDHAAISEAETLRGVCQVRDKDGHPVPDAEMIFLAHGWSGKTVIEIKRTDAKGEATFALDRDSFVRSGHAIQFEFFAKKPDIGLGASGSFDFWQMDKKVHELTLETGTEVAVKLVNSTGQGLAGVRVFASSWIHDDPWKRVRPGGFSDDFWTGVTGPNGVATIRNLPVGVTVEWGHDAEGFAKLNTSAGYVPRGKTTLVGTESEVTLELEPGASVSGRIVATEGKGVPNAQISLIERSSTDGCTYRATSDGEGVFRIEGVIAGAYELHTFLDWTGIATDKWSASPLHLVQVDAGRSLDEIEVKLMKTGRVRGRITLEGRGEGVAGITVESANSKVTNTIGQISSTTNVDGYYDLPVSPGDRVLWAKNGAGASIGERVAFSVKETEIVTRDFQIPKADAIGQRIEIRGSIIDKNGEPVAGASVVSTLNLNWFTPQQVSSDAAGEFVLPAFPLANSHALFAWKDDQATTVRFDLPFDEEKIVLQLKEIKRPKLSGRVIGSTGDPIAGADVRWGAGLIEGIEQTTLTDAEGWFRFSMLPPFESIPLVARKAGFGRVETVVTFGDLSEVTTENLILQTADQRVSGKVVDADGKPASDVWVAVIGMTQPAVEVFTNESGRFELAGIVGAPLKIHAVARTPTGNIERMEDARAGDTGIVIRLPPSS